MIPSSDVDIVIVDNTSLLEKIAALLNEVPWIREVRVGDVWWASLVAHQGLGAGGEGDH